ncbi:helix-turn-helix transcriptional regulator [Nitriliruptoraceae bacterium ZYF776]|nr:helix-turn-helix transcriptional regulator [Profundirhabdus halotolerans]
MTTPPRDRLRELLDAVLEGTDDPARTGPRPLDAMAGDAATSPFHFSRLLSRATGEPPVAMRRRVLLERACWQLRRGTPVTDAAFDAGYGSVEGFARAFARAYGCPPSQASGAHHWLPAPNGIHFHPPTSLWVRAEERPMAPLTEQLVAHDLDDTRHLLELAKGLPAGDLRAPLRPGARVLSWDGPEESVGAVLHRQVASKQVWLAAIEGDAMPDLDGEVALPDLVARHDAVAPRWLACVRDIDRRGAWEDRLIDALCDPPESFVLGDVLAHVLTYAAHRRQLVRQLLRELGHEVDEGDPILWLQARRGDDR